MPQSVLEIANDLTLALLEAGSLSADDLQTTLQKTFTTLAALQAQEETGSGTIKIHKPVDWRVSITQHSVACLECGRTFKQLSIRHLREHGLNARTYRTKYDIPHSQSLAARATAAKRRRIAAEVKPWEKSPRYMQAQEAKAATAKQSGRKKGKQKG
jgi:predicted transcriptional regulator